MASDHAGYEIKESVGLLCADLGHAVDDLGPTSADRVDYPDYAEKVARLVARGEADRGILICGSGIGMSIAANRVAGVRAVVAMVGLQARLAREHNDANVLCLGARLSGPSLVEEMVRVFLETEFQGGRHAGRVAKLDAIDARERPAG